MQQVDFYLLEETSSQAEQHFICRLVAQLYRNKKSIYLHVEDAQHAEQTDQLLWGFRADSFIPHEIISQEPSSQESLPQGNTNDKTPVYSPIVISSSPDSTHQADVLINLAKVIPSFYERFERIAEIVPSNENKRALLRKHYRFYKEKNCELKTHNIATPQ